MTKKPGRWKKRIAVAFLVLLGAIMVAVAAMPELRQGLALLWVYNANSFASHEWRAAESSDTISFHYDRHILVPATVQSERPILIALDTGAPMSALIDGPHLDGMQFETGRTVPIGGSGQGITPRAQVLNELELAIGAVELSDFTALLIPWEQMGEFFTSPEQVYIHGILGYDLFSRYVIEIDFDRELLTLHTADEFDYSGGGDVIPLTYVQRKPYIEAEITQLDGSTVAVKLQVDLGKPSALSLIPSEEASIVVPPDAVAAESRGLSGRVEERMSRLRTLRLGKYEVPDVVTAFSIQGFATSADRNGVLGLDVLARFRVIMDYPRNRMILEPTGNEAPFEDDMSGIAWVPQGDAYAIRVIRTDSPADNAGLQVGDELVSIDGIDASEIRFGDLVERMRAGDDVDVALELRRGGEPVSVVLTLEKRV